MTCGCHRYIPGVGHFQYGAQQLRSAFAKWAAVSPFQFAEASEGKVADLQIAFYSGDHGDGHPFDGPGKILAHVFAPTNERLHFDADETWLLDATGMNRVDLESVAVHEISHLLGLGHSADESAIMYPSIGADVRKVELSSNDVQIGYFALRCLSSELERRQYCPRGEHCREDRPQLLCSILLIVGREGVLEITLRIRPPGHVWKECVMHDEMADEFSDEFSEDLDAALRTYQLNFNLNTSGVLDEPTVQKLIQPRYRVADIVNDTNLMTCGRHRYIPGVGHFVMHYAFFPDMPRWPDSQRNLKYTFSTDNQQYGAQQLRSVFFAAFAKWAAVSPF
ncbi:putative metalloproteinase 165R [Nymphaea thermarum]|nr:putative metalloproteinase 165R [Nymphaea thermarum]